MTQSIDMDRVIQLPLYLARLLDNEADHGQPRVFDSSDDSGQILFCPITFMTQVVSSHPQPMAADPVADSVPQDPSCA
jgi:hypothetical protein